METRNVTLATNWNIVLVGLVEVLKIKQKIN